MRRLSRRDSDDDLLAGTTFDKWMDGWMDVGTNYVCCNHNAICNALQNTDGVSSVKCRVKDIQISAGLGAARGEVVGCTVHCCMHVAYD
jgi:hypothetical protein